ncbi:carboxypeptidase regulatory-like domain-containing protein [[Clostridium] hylemonae]|uniref:Leucine Rich Repeat protein n=1 Tax=[Clostridium] hylemonae DSM 15053 TaxID=553973 RepID=C0C4T7_9FIRM|nr:carboxypeptidase regulatory-like domain-containing protein [[Clostridium] hylemonae]EEG72705.1 hypothetical protein CLOHYLEM_07103 [[Clostridium] hylemonae DSM 15053]QEK16182.1 Internalin-J [[Clostridium] hylemonae DSM 15053]
MKRKKRLAAFLAITLTLLSSNFTVLAEETADEIMVSGTVTDTNGYDVDGAVVTLAGGGQSFDTVLTNGSYSVYVPEGTYEVTVAKPGYTIEVKDTTPIEVIDSDVFRDISVSVTPQPNKSAAKTDVPAPPADEIPFDKVHFPDDAFRTYLKDTLKIDKDGNGALSETEIAAVDRIWIQDNPNLKSLEGLKYFTALEILTCGGAGLTELNIKDNKILKGVYLYNNLGITSLDTSSNTELDAISCYNTGIESLDISQNKKLTALNCSSTNLKTLDVSANTILKGLDCHETAIESLDVSKNTALIYLRCYNTEIKSLDVSNCTVLEELKCKDTPLAYLKIGTNALSKLKTLEKPEPSSIKLKEKAKTFKITDKFTGIDPAKITVKNGAKYDSTTGIVSEYNDEDPIEYSYDCGIYSNNDDSVTLDVKLKVFQKEESSIKITANDLDKTYDGTAVSSAPAVTKTGSTGAVTYIWEKQQKGGVSWEKISGTPTDAGYYRVTAHVAADDDYKAADSSPKEFMIWQADNNWTSGLAIGDWVYGTPANTPSATPRFGTVSYTYSNSRTETFKEDVPTAAGTWYVKAAVAGTDNYTGLEKIIDFKITKANAPAITLPDNLSGIQGDLLSTVKLPSGWAWEDDSQTLAIGNNGYKARLTVDDSNYDYMGVTDYDASGHYVEKVLSVTVSLEQNNWTVFPSILDWTYGDTASTPAGHAAYGTATFTYSDSKDGTFSKEVPTAAGIWYMKVSVAAEHGYTGLDTIVKFTIMPKNMETDNQIKIPEISADTNLDELTLMDGKKVLVQGKDYDVTKKQDGNKVTVTITFKGNYTGTITKSYTVDDKKLVLNPNTDKNTPSGQTGAVKTGDNAASGFWIVLMAMAAGTAVLTGRKRYKEK